MMRRRLAWLSQRVGARWRALGHWFAANSLAPDWLPASWRQPLVGYLFAGGLTLLAIALELLAAQVISHLDAVSGVFVFLVILFVGLQWGAGPSLLATVLGTALLYCLIDPPLFSITRKQLVDILQGGLVLFGGLFVTQTASQRERQRRAAEVRAREADRERKRLRAVLETMLAMLAAMVQTPPGAGPPPPATGGPTEDPVAQRLAELMYYALGGQAVGLFSLEPTTGALTPLGVVGHSPEHAQPWGSTPGQRISDHAWLEAPLMARLQAGEAVPVDLPQSLPPDGRPARKTRLLVVPIRREGTLLGLMILDPPWSTPQAPPEDLALVDALARLSALTLEREQLVRAREQAQAEALAHRAATRQMEAFVEVAGHELKTPLASLQLGLQAAQHRLDRLIHQAETGQTVDQGPLPLERVQQYLEPLPQSVDRLERLVRDLLDSTHLAAGSLELHPELADLRAIVAAAVKEQRTHTPDRTICLQALPEQPVLVRADVQRIAQVVSYYLTNALKYSAETYPVEVGVGVDGQQGCVWVRDSGPGVPAGQQTSLWERFYRAPEVQVESGSGVGLGLGLYISRALVEQHGGAVGVQSTPGHGSRFWFTLTLEQAAAS
jgi:signal transduction histidine kinase